MRRDLLASTAIVTGPALPRPPREIPLERARAILGDALVNQFDDPMCEERDGGVQLRERHPQDAGERRYRITGITASALTFSEVPRAARRSGGQTVCLYDSGPMPIWGD